MHAVEVAYCMPVKNAFFYNQSDACSRWDNAKIVCAVEVANCVLHAYL